MNKLLEIKKFADLFGSEKMNEDNFSLEYEGSPLDFNVNEFNYLFNACGRELIAKVKTKGCILFTYHFNDKSFVMWYIYYDDSLRNKVSSGWKLYKRNYTYMNAEVVAEKEYEDFNPFSNPMLLCEDVPTED